jgi:hypothetical protein
LRQIHKLSENSIPEAQAADQIRTGK